MKKFNAIKTSVTLVVAALTLTLVGAGVGVALAATGNIENDGQDYVGRIVVITDPRATSSGHCGTPYDDYKCVIINSTGGPAVVTVCGVDPSLTVNAGDRFIITSATQCNGRLDLTLLED